MRENLTDGISITRNHHDTIVWLQFDSSFFNFEEDIYFGAVYMWGENSPAFNTINCNLFEILETDIF